MIGVSTLCLFLVVAIIFIKLSNYLALKDFQKKRSTIQKGNQVQQIGQNLIADLARSSLSDERIKNLLLRNGISVTFNTNNTQQIAP